MNQCIYNEPKDEIGNKLFSKKTIKLSPIKRTIGGFLLLIFLPAYSIEKYFDIGMDNNVKRILNNDSIQEEEKYRLIRNILNIKYGYLKHQKKLNYNGKPFYLNPNGDFIKGFNNVVGIYKKDKLYYYLLDGEGKVISGPYLDFVKQYKNLYMVTKKDEMGKKYLLIDLYGNIKGEFLDYINVEKGYWIVCNNGVSNFLNEYGVIVGGDYEEIFTPFSYGLFLVKKQGKYYFIDADLQEKIGPFDNASPFFTGSNIGRKIGQISLVKVGENEYYINIKGEKISNELYIDLHK